ncbi:hypothetical protein [Microcoleus sp. D2_18a_B4]|uniref:hypothetical protein n=1 Tax=Microcoleus sp. D2_18a_B4 TaxID=3055329 RepID=UPI002FD4F871
MQQSSKLELGVRSQESGGKKKKEEGRRKKEGAIISVFTNMRCSLFNPSFYSQPSTVNRQPSTVNRQPSTVNRQPSTMIRSATGININPCCE